MPPTVIAAGYNIDADLLRETLEILQEFEHEILSPSAFGSTSTEPGNHVEQLLSRLRGALSADSFTPETLSAAYARISRDPKHVTELRKAARYSVARARKSNENIIFGLGHASVAEHACFNFDISGLSRLACEELQNHRLASFTEKSQRYITLDADYILPPELLQTHWKDKFDSILPQTFRAYSDLCAKLELFHGKSTGDNLSKDEIRDIETRSKEDARYLLPLACVTQMGMTANARNVEYIVRDFSDHPLQEVRELGTGLGKAAARLAPSLVKYTERGTYPRENRQKLSDQLSRSRTPIGNEFDSEPCVKLVDSTPHAETKVLNAIGFRFGEGTSRAAADRDVWKRLFHAMSVHDTAPRELELVSLTFEGLISASCYAQLKRHRMLTLLHSPYQVDLGFILPPSIREAGLETEFISAIREISNASRELKNEYPLCAPYLLTNAHRRKVIIHLNARELFHFTRLRSDSHAQWEIRSLSDQMLAVAKGEWPNLCALACGKDQFENVYRDWFAE